MGRNLVEEVIEHIDLPHDFLVKEIAELLERTKLNPEAADLDELRRAVASYLQDVFIATKEELEAEAELNK